MIKLTNSIFHFPFYFFPIPSLQLSFKSQCSLFIPSHPFSFPFFCSHWFHFLPRSIPYVFKFPSLFIFPLQSITVPRLSRTTSCNIATCIRFQNLSFPTQSRFELFHNVIFLSLNALSIEQFPHFTSIPLLNQAKTWSFHLDLFLPFITTRKLFIFSSAETFSEKSTGFPMQPI